jgi:hypothetical protein
MPTFEKIAVQNFLGGRESETVGAISKEERDRGGNKPANIFTIAR